MEPPNWDEPVPLSDVAPFGQPFGLSQGWLPTALPEVPPLIEPPVAGPLPLTAPALSPPIAEVPVPLNVVGPPAVPLAPRRGALPADEPFHGGFLFVVRTANRKGGVQRDVDQTYVGRVWGDSFLRLCENGSENGKGLKY